MSVKKTYLAMPFDEHRRVFVYLPSGYRKSDKRYPVLYMYDGHNLFFDDTATYGKCWGLKEYLDARKAQIIVIGVECSHEGNERLSEYSPYSFYNRHMGRVKGKGKITMDWMSTELKAWADANFRTMPEREHTAIAGSSMGGLMAIWSVSAYNHVYSKAACLSSFLHYNHQKILRSLDHPYGADTRAYISWGAEEFSSRKYLAMGTAENLNAANVLLKNGVSVYLNQPVKGQHNEASWEKEIDVFMRFLFPEIVEKG